MTCLAFCADAHLANHKLLGGPMAGGINRRAAQCIDVLRRLVGLCTAEGVSHLFVLGDLFDGVKPEPQLTAAAQEVLSSVRAGTRLYLVLGNHERVSEESGDHALGPLAPIATVVERPLLVTIDEARTEVLLVPYVNDRPAPGVLRETLERALWTEGYRRLLGFHFGVKDSATPIWLRGASDAIEVDTLYELLRKHGVEAAFAGHWHQHQCWQLTSPPIEQLGALVPNGFRDPGLGETYGRVRLFHCGGRDSGVGELCRVDGPRFISFHADSDVGNVDPGPLGYLHVTTCRADRRAVAALLDEKVHDGKLCDYKLDLDKNESRAAARAAAMSARKAETLLEATASFVGQMPLDDDVDRAVVLDTVNDYLK